MITIPIHDDQTGNSTITIHDSNDLQMATGTDVSLFKNQIFVFFAQNQFSTTYVSQQRKLRFGCRFVYALLKRSQDDL
jgi:hypothetical protein